MIVFAGDHPRIRPARGEAKLRSYITPEYTNLLRKIIRLMFKQGPLGNSCLSLQDNPDIDLADPADKASEKDRGPASVDLCTHGERPERVVQGWRTNVSLDAAWQVQMGDKESDHLVGLLKVKIGSLPSVHPDHPTGQP